MFVGRREEMEKLNQFYKTSNFEMLILYGRRRVGKTRLLTEFIKEKNAIFFVAEENNDRRNLQRFSEAVMDHYEKDMAASFDQWTDALTYIARRAQEERTVLVIDELPYIVQGNEAFMSVLQNTIDHVLKNSNLMVVLSGSYVSFMEDQLVSAKSPLYGRKTGQMKLNPLSFSEASEMFPDYSFHDRLRIYTICGGIPHYLVSIDPNRSVDRNIVDKFMNNTSFLYDEPMDLLRQELRSPAVYNAIISAIADGANKINEISQVVNESSSKVTVYIKTLVELGIIERVSPIGTKTKRKSYYKLIDNLFVFMHHYVYRFRSLIEQGLGQQIYEKRVKGEMKTRYGYVFEDICLEYLRARNKKLELPFLVEEFGTWWGPNPVLQKEEEIDLIGLTKYDGLYCECKYRSKDVGVNVYERLIERSLLLPRKRQYYILFSKDRFSDQLIEKASNDPQTELITQRDIDEWFRANSM